MCQQQPACRPARCWHWGVTGSPNCVSARPQPRQSQVGGAGAWTEAAPGPEPGGPWQLGLLAFSTVDMRGGPGRRRCISFIARGSEGVGRGASARVAPPRCFPTPRCSQSQRPLQLPLLPPRPLPRRLRQALRFQRRHQRGRPPRRPCRGRAAAGGQGRFARGGASQGRARPSERAAPPRPTQGRRGSRSPQRGWRRGSGPRTRLAAGRRGSEGAGLQAGPRKVAPRKAEGRQRRLRRHSTMKAMTWAMAGHLRCCRRGGRWSFSQRPQTAESVRARP